MSCHSVSVVAITYPDNPDRQDRSARHIYINSQIDAHSYIQTDKTGPVRSDLRRRLRAPALKARVLGSNPGGVGGIAVLGKLLTDHASVASAV